MPGVVANVPNAGPKYVPISTEILARCATEVVSHFRQALCAAIGLDEEEDDFRVLFGERDLCEGDSAREEEFKNKLGSGKPCMVRVLFRLLGGKGGFGALLRKQANKGKKTTNMDAMRDLTGRRLRHSYAVDRIKEWMEKQNREDELVNLIQGEGPEMPKPVPASESLDPEFVRKLKRSSAERPAVVSEGMRVRDALEGQDAVKRVRADGFGNAVGSSSSSSGGGQPGVWLGALDSLGDLSSASPGPDDSEASPDGEETNDKSAAPSQSVAGAAAVSSAAASASKEETDATTLTKQTEATKSADRASALAEAIAESFCVASEARESEEVSSKGARSRAGASDSAALLDPTAAVECIGPEDLKKFKTAEDLAAKVSAETLKQSLQKFGLKCGGTPQDRAARFFLLKATPLEDLPKKEFAKK